MTLSANFLSLVSWLLSNYVSCFIVNYYDNYDIHHDFTTVMVTVQLILQLSSNFYGYMWLYLLNYLQLVLSPHHDCLNLMYKDQITTQGSLHHTLCNLEFNELRYQKLILSLFQVQIKALSSIFLMYICSSMYSVFIYLIQCTYKLTLLALYFNYGT